MKKGGNNLQRLLIGFLVIVVVSLFITSLFIGSNPLPVLQAARESLLDTPTVIGLIFWRDSFCRVR